MLGHWYIIANRRAVDIYTVESDEGRLGFVKSLENPLGKERRSSLIRKQAGKGQRSVGRVGTVHYSNNKDSDPVEDAALQFARELAKFLSTERLKKKYTSLTVYAEPHFLGMIKSVLKPQVSKTVGKWVQKDLNNFPIKKLETFILPKKPRPKARPAFKFSQP